MGGEVYWYVVPFEKNLDAALQKLRQRELMAGRYNPVMPFLRFPITPASPAPGGQHTSFDDALDAADADGTRSIIDITRVSPVPNDGSQEPYMTAWPLTDDELADLTGSARPDLKSVLDSDIWENVERGSGFYVILYNGDTPAEILFGGMSFD